IATTEERSNPVRYRPDVQCHHQNRWTIACRHGGNELLGCLAQHRKAALAGFTQLGIGFQRNAGLEHGRVIGGLAPCEVQIGFPHVFKGLEDIGAAAAPRAFQRSLELLVTTPCDIGEKLVAIAEMPVRRCGAHPRPPRRLGKGKPGRALLRDQCECRADQRLFQIAMVIAARTRGAVVLAPAHVKRLYMTRNGTSNAAWSGPKRRGLVARMSGAKSGVPAYRFAHAGYCARIATSL